MSHVVATCMICCLACTFVLYMCVGFVACFLHLYRCANPIRISQDVSAGGGGSDGSGSGGADLSAAAVPSPSDLAASAAPVYLDEVPQCAGLTASQCEDLLSGE